MPDKSPQPILMPIGHYSDVQQAERDVKRLEELGFHPVIRKPTNPADVQAAEDTAEAHDLVVAVPEPEAGSARESLELTFEAQGDAHDQGYD